jgi:DNA-binding MarR family transcriptional regulator
MKGRIVTALTGSTGMTQKEIAEKIGETQAALKEPLKILVDNKVIFKKKDQYALKPF